MSDRLTPEREAEIRERATKRAAALTAWIDKFSPFPEGQREVENAETVLEEDVPALLAELDAVRAERDQAQARIAELEKVNAGLDDLRIRAIDKGDQLRDRIDEVERKYTFDTAELKRRVAELEALTEHAIQFRIEGPGSRPALLIRRSLRGKWAVIEAEARGRRKALTRSGWRIAAVLADSDVFIWPDAATAMTEARKTATPTDRAEEAS